MNQQEYRDVSCQSVFSEGIPRYEFKLTKRIAYCIRCGRKIDKKEVRLRVITPYNRLILCSTGVCVEWFFEQLLKRKGVV